MTENTHPLVSIVVPVYNGERFLKDALNGIRNQTYTNWEALIVDDCSTDATPSIAGEFTDVDKRFKYFRNEENKKLPKTLNAGFARAQGKYHTWTSDDNVFRPKAIATMVNWMETHSETGLVYCNIQRIDSEGSPIPFPKPPLSPSMLNVYNVVQACFLYRSEVTEKLGGYDETLFLVEDYDFWLRAKRYFKFHHIDEVQYDYRMHEGALTKTKKQAIRDRTREVLAREFHCKDLSPAQRLMALAGLTFNKVRTTTNF